MQEDCVTAGYPNLKTVIIFISASIILYIATHFCVPLLSEITGWTMVVCWFICGGLLVFAPLFFIPLIILKYSRCSADNSRLHELGFKKMNREDWRWAALGLLLVVILSGAIWFLFEKMAEVIPGIAPLNPQPSFFKMKPLSTDEYWILLAWLPFFFFNIFGEEIMWRGYLLQRMVRENGKPAWMIQGLLWGVFHFSFGLDLIIMLLPIFFVLPYIVQKRKNTWIGVFIHGAYNGPAFIAVALGLIS